LRDTLNPWSVYQGNQEIFASVLHVTGKWTIDEGLDLIHDFIVDKLPSALKTYDPEKGELKKWLYIVFLRYAKRRRIEISRSRNRTVDLDSLPGLIDESISSDKFVAYLQHQDIVDALGDIDQKHRLILNFYFGDEKKSGNIREIARKFEISRHLAEKMVLEGLAILSVKLNEPGILSNEEWEVCKYYLAQKYTWQRVAEKIDKTENQARNILRNALGKFRTILKRYN
jgi:RNA polymerase sigma factor (sigma-70 family)